MITIEPISCPKLRKI